MLTYKVGGSVRDHLLGLPVSDQDWVVVGATPQTMLDLGFRQVGADFPVFLHPQSGEEYALARTERKSGPGYLGFTVNFDPGVTLEEDLERRDLTINALAMDKTGRIIDPFGGREDLKNRILRHVSPAFGEDPLRVLRVARFFARFHALGFQIAPDTLNLMTQLVDSGELDHLTPERVWMETVKALASPRPSRYFETLRISRGLAVIFPELAALIGQSQPSKHHPEGDAWVHTLEVLDRAAELSSHLPVRFASLMHDLGKGATPKDELPHHYGHDEVGGQLVEKFCQRLRAPKSYRKLAVLAARFHIRCHLAEEMQAKKIVKLLVATDAFRHPDRFQNLLTVCQADAQGRGQSEKQGYPEGDILLAGLKACQKVDHQKLLAQGFQGDQFAQALHQERVRLVKTVLAERADSTEESTRRYKRE
ncbi:MAG: multifunctional CCA addition/repair protein [Magnetococcales bacterium]|nr:multifunctional CCA addition/repair protein [Magnetococcales bacterium]